VKVFCPLQEADGILQGWDSLSYRSWHCLPFALITSHLPFTGVQRRTPIHVASHTHTFCLFTVLGLWKGGHSLSCLSALPFYISYRLSPFCVPEFSYSLQAARWLIFLPWIMSAPTQTILSPSWWKHIYLKHRCQCIILYSVKIQKIVIRLGFWEGHITITVGIGKKNRQLL